MFKVISEVSITYLPPLGEKSAKVAADAAPDNFLTAEKVKEYQNQLNTNLPKGMKAIVDAVFGTAGVQKVGRGVFLEKLSSPQLKAVVTSYGFRTFVNS
jgi:NAD(P)H-hydrate repair Nnr-like enzyme with NAD(P)H-hydrate epimerase domain